MRKLIGTVVILGGLSLLGACTNQWGQGMNNMGSGMGYAANRTVTTADDMVMGADGRMHHREMMHHKHHCKHHHKHHGKKHHGKHHHKHHHKAHKTDATKKSS